MIEFVGMGLCLFMFYCLYLKIFWGDKELVLLIVFRILVGVWEGG